MKYIIGLILAGYALTLVPIAKADNVYFFQNGEGYNTNQELVYYRFANGTCFDINGTYVEACSLVNASSTIATIDLPVIAPVVPPVQPQPTPIPTPTVQPVPVSSTSTPALNPVLSHYDLAQKEKGYLFSAICNASSTTTARCDGNGQYSNRATISFGGIIVWDGSKPYGGVPLYKDDFNNTTILDTITDLTPSTEYQYSVLLDGNIIAVSSFTTPNK